MQFRHGRTGFRRLLPATGKYFLGMRQQLLLPLHDLVRVDFKLLGQFVQRLVPAIAASATFALNPVEWFRLGRLFVISLLLPGDSPSRLEQFITYPGVQNSPTSSGYADHRIVKDVSDECA